MVDLSSSLCERLPLKITIEIVSFPMKNGGLPEANPMLPVDPMPQKAPPPAKCFCAKPRDRRTCAEPRVASAEQRRSVGLRGRGFPMNNGGFMGKS